MSVEKMVVEKILDAVDYKTTLAVHEVMVEVKNLEKIVV